MSENEKRKRLATIADALFCLEMKDRWEREDFEKSDALEKEAEKIREELKNERRTTRNMENNKKFF